MADSAVTPHRFGANGALVEATLDRPASGLQPREAAIATLMQHICQVVADADTPGGRARARIAHLVTEAALLDWRAVQSIRAEMERRFGAELEVHVPAGEPRRNARRLLLAAALWPAVHGANENPFVAALDAARAGTFVEVGEHRVHEWHMGLEVPARLACGSGSGGQALAQPRGLVLLGDD